ncbi:MAG: hypothetical protein HY282_10840 [Nitrospirae bacterium]|nr:hypothetical protein [Candidatus Manganitrophaceae bacterium]
MAESVFVPRAYKVRGIYDDAIQDYGERKTEEESSRRDLGSAYVQFDMSGNDKRRFWIFKAKRSPRPIRSGHGAIFQQD